MWGIRCRACRRPDNKRPGVALQATWWWQRVKQHGAPTVTHLTPSVYWEAIWAYSCWLREKNGGNINIIHAQTLLLNIKSANKRQVVSRVPSCHARTASLSPPSSGSSSFPQFYDTLFIHLPLIHEALPIPIPGPCCGRRISTQSHLQENQAANLSPETRLRFSL